MIPDFEEQLCRAHCCAAQMGNEYVLKWQKGRNNEQDFFTLILIDQYLDTLDRYKNSLSLTTEQRCSCCHEHEQSCLTENQVLDILAQIITLCGSCSCNC